MTSEIAKVPGSSAWTSSSSDPNLTMAEEAHPLIKEVKEILALTSAGCIVNINIGNQGDFIVGVGGDIIKGVRGSIVKGVRGNIIKDKEGNVFEPRFVVLKSKYRGKFLRLTENDGSLPEGFLKFEGGKVATEQAKFELEPEKNGNEFVHLKCCYNNKYLVRYNGNLDTACKSSSHWIVAAADKTEENKCNISCTLFKLEPVNVRGELEFRLRHIQLNEHACLWTCSKLDHHRNFGGLHGGSGAPDKDDFNVYTVVAWESLENKMNKAAMETRFAAPKLLKPMCNSNYLSFTENDSRLPAGFLKFNGEEVASPLAKFKVEMENNGNGLVHIRCCYNNKYLVTENTPIDSSRNNNKYWIVAAADEPEKDDNKLLCTLFKPEPYNESGLQFRFLHINLGLYICMWKITDSDSDPSHKGLYVGSSSPHTEAFDVFTLVD